MISSTGTNVNCPRILTLIWVRALGFSSSVLCTPSRAAKSSRTRNKACCKRALRIGLTR